MGIDFWPEGGFVQSSYLVQVLGNTVSNLFSSFTLWFKKVKKESKPHVPRIPKKISGAPPAKEYLNTFLQWHEGILSRENSSTQSTTKLCRSFNNKRTSRVAASPGLVSAPGEGGKGCGRRKWLQGNRLDSGSGGWPRGVGVVEPSKLRLRRRKLREWATGWGKWRASAVVVATGKWADGRKGWGVGEEGWSEY